MSEFKRLLEMVAKLRAKDGAGTDVRALRGGDATTRLASLLAEVNETILPRRLMFQWDTGEGIQLAVANRRLQGVLSPSAEPLALLAGQPLSDPEDDLSSNVRDALLTLLETGEPVRIRSVHLGGDDLGSDAGLAAETLARHWGLEQESSSADASVDAVPDFLSALNANALAWLRVEGEDVVEQGGSEADVAKLGETAAYLLDAYLNGRDALFGVDPGQTSYAVAGAERGVFFADTGTQTIFALTSPEGVVPVAAAWRASFG